VKNRYAHVLYSAYKFPLGEDFNTNEFIQRVLPFQEYYLRNEEFQIQKKILNSNFYIFRLKAFDLNLDSDMRLGDRFIKETLTERKNYDYKVICNGIVLEVSLPLM
jgi:cellulose synthase/poly-beta-1,6-N-acetylglucosamine synthase-like glycosyltransferase